MMRLGLVDEFNGVVCIATKRAGFTMEAPPDGDARRFWEEDRRRAERAMVDGLSATWFVRVSEGEIDPAGRWTQRAVRYTPLDASDDDEFFPAIRFLAKQRDGDTIEKLVAARRSGR